MSHQAKEVRNGWQKKVRRRKGWTSAEAATRALLQTGPALTEEEEIKLTEDH